MKMSGQRMTWTSFDDTGYEARWRGVDPTSPPSELPRDCHRLVINQGTVLLYYPRVPWRATPVPRHSRKAYIGELFLFQYQYLALQPQDFMATSSGSVSCNGK